MGTASLVIPGFEDATRIANGGSSTIYRARLFSGEDVAVKVAKPGYEERIRKEYSTQYDLSNPRSPDPNIVEAISSGETIERMPYFAMELMEGDFKYILRNQKPDFKKALGYLEDILNGVGSAHKKGIVHGDLKPSNVLFKGRKVKIADFGLGVKYSGSDLTSSVT